VGKFKKIAQIIMIFKFLLKSLILRHEIANQNSNIPNQAIAFDQKVK